MKTNFPPTINTINTCHMHHMDPKLCHLQLNQGFLGITSSWNQWFCSL